MPEACPSAYGACRAYNDPATCVQSQIMFETFNVPAMYVAIQVSGLTGRAECALPESNGPAWFVAATHLLARSLASTSCTSTTLQSCIRATTHPHPCSVHLHMHKTKACALAVETWSG